MDKEMAKSIIDDFFSDMNPDLWNGNGDKPVSFDSRPWQYPLSNEVNLEITVVFDTENGWYHCCDLVHTQDDSSFDVASGSGIDSKEKIADTVMKLCSRNQW